MEGTDSLMEEISYDEIQAMMDNALGNNAFDFGDYVGSLVSGEVSFSAQEFLHTIISGVQDNFIHERQSYLLLILLALMGAVLANFSKLLQGKEVAGMAFYSVYMIFFSVLSAAYAQLNGVAFDTLNRLLDFVKVLAPTYFMCLSFTQGAAMGSVYYQFILVLIVLAEIVLLNVIMPMIQIYFFLQIANQISERDLFSKMAKLIADIVKFVMKTMLGLVMGINVVQGLILPSVSEMKNNTLVRFSSMVPGVGNTISNVAGTVLGAGNLVKNAVGVTGVIVVFIMCALPLAKILLAKICYQFMSAIVQPVSDIRIVRCLEAITETLSMEMYAVGSGCLMFVISIAIISSMTNINI